MACMNWSVINLSIIYLENSTLLIFKLLTIILMSLILHKWLYCSLGILFILTCRILDIYIHAILFAILIIYII